MVQAWGLGTVGAIDWCCPPPRPVPLHPGTMPEPLWGWTVPTWVPEASGGRYHPGIEGRGFPFWENHLIKMRSQPPWCREDGERGWGGVGGGSGGVVGGVGAGSGPGSLMACAATCWLPEEPRRRVLAPCLLLGGSLDSRGISASWKDPPSWEDPHILGGSPNPQRVLAFWGVSRRPLEHPCPRGHHAGVG